ncbi:unnamed protein product [Staurois parvus]|uniref:Uncharacterized protein n=1 Tax=Staurois parvus TaxID=386267 RepID=A0ABN9HRF6_9NEOB|nr:unnamed protein product [Staurois parvus]
MYVKWFDTGMLYYVILVYLVNVTFKMFEFPAGCGPCTFWNGTRKTDAGISRRRWPGTLQGRTSQERRTR